jgi:TatD DNase family protein
VAEGFVISIACPITYPANETAREMVRNLPLRSLVIETDSPYLPPQGRRGQLNEPAYVMEAARTIAAVKDETLERVLESTTENARRLFGLRDQREVVAA